MHHGIVPSLILLYHRYMCNNIDSIGVSITAGISAADTLIIPVSVIGTKGRGVDINTKYNTRA